MGCSCNIQYLDGHGWYVDEDTYELCYAGYDIRGSKVAVTDSMIDDYLARYNSFNRRR